MERKKFYLEQTQLELPTRYAGVIHGILINTQWKIILQKRAENKWHNPWMWDKSIGGHIQYGSIARSTIEEESIQEIWVPCYLAIDENDFSRRLKIYKDYMKQIAVMKHVWQYLSIDTRVMWWKKVQIWNKIDFFIWVSDVTPKLNDGEVQNTQALSLEDLERILDTDSQWENYTDDLKAIIKNQRWNILWILELLSELNKTS